jgi:hypothetical protein
LNAQTDNLVGPDSPVASDIQAQDVRPTALPQDPVETEESAIAANIPNPTETTMGSITPHPPPADTTGATIESGPHGGLRHDVMGQHVHPPPSTQAPAGPANIDESATAANMPNPTETMTALHTPPLATVTTRPATGPGFHERPRLDIIDPQARPASSRYAPRGPFNTGESATAANMPNPAETMMAYQTPPLATVSTRRPATGSGLHERPRRDTMDQHVRPYSSRYVPRGPFNIGESATAANRSNPTEAMTASYTPRPVPAGHRRTVTEPEIHAVRRDVLGQHVRPLSFPQPSPSIADTEGNAGDAGIPATRESDAGSVTSRLGSAAAIPDILGTNIPPAPQQPIDVERNAPANPEPDTVSFSIFITPTCITPQIKWQVPGPKKKTWVQHRLPFLKGTSNH